MKNIKIYGFIILFLLNFIFSFDIYANPLIKFVTTLAKTDQTIPEKIKAEFQCIKVPHTDKSIITSMTLNKYKQLVVMGYGNGIIKIWKIQDNNQLELIQTLDQNSKGHTNGVTSVKFNENGCLLFSSSYDKTIKIWEKKENNQFELIQTLDQNSDGHTDTIGSITFKNGLLVSGSWDKTIKIWKIKDNNQFELIQTLADGHTESIYSISFNKNGRLLASSSSDKTIKIWEKKENNQFELIQTLADGHTESIYSVAFNDGNNSKSLLASGSVDKTIKIWEIQKNNQFKLIQTIDQNSDGHTDTIGSITFKKNILISSSWDSSIKIWKIQKNNQFKLIQTIRTKEKNLWLSTILEFDNNLMDIDKIERIEYLNNEFINNTNLFPTFKVTTNQLSHKTKLTIPHSLLYFKQK